MKKILILTSGSKKKLAGFKSEFVTIASFNEIEFKSGSKKLLLDGEIDIVSFDIIYFRLVGKSLENASLIANYAVSNGVRLVDRIYEKSLVYPVSLSKAIEMKKLLDAEVLTPKTYFASISRIKEKGEELLGFPYVIKSTSGKKGKEVWSPKTKMELNKLCKTLQEEEKKGKSFFAQEFIRATERIRVLVIGGNVVGSIRQLARWRKRVTGEVPDQDSKKIDIFIPSEEVKDLALSATKVVGLDIAGVDILFDEKRKNYFVIEVNAAPSWKLISKYCNVNVEKEILNFFKKV